MPPKIIFVRHAEAEHNKAHKLNFDDSVFSDERYADAPLTEEGYSQVNNLCKSLTKYSIIDVWSSPLTRAIQTAEKIVESSLADNLILHDNLLEISGNTHKCNTRKNKKDLKKLFPKCDFTYIPDTPCIWNSLENEYSAYQRLFLITKLIEDIYKHYPDDTAVVVVSHWAVLFAFLKQKLQNAEYYEYNLE